MRYDGPGESWRCANGAPVGIGVGGALWAAVQALVVHLQAGGAMLSWIDRGLAAPVPTSPPPSLGWLGGLESSELAGRPEL